MTERWTEETLDRFAATVATAIAAGNERMSRLDDRMEELTAVTQTIGRDLAQLIAIQQAGQEELTAVTQAIGRDLAQLISTQQQSSTELNHAMIRLAGTQEGIARLLSNLDEDRPTILRKLNVIENKVDRLLEQ
ncbi:hypothetical protein [Pseudanabaena sp. PCC 6802]|uniref:hypothetical protein n=1 Tax=Pseudanabaena sp. PCC 6802 TaxID=118173 RepID=UPI00037A170A|nr:hypothetical protein [Pseudanabaena sp. PCC 6802]